MRSIELEELKRLQCEVLQVAHDFCLQHGIKYSLACGTLLGAIRHNGYIPWDDDIDIYMMREDYDRFIRLFPEVYKEHYKLISFERSNRWARAFANLYDDRTVWEEAKNSVEEQIGINIDIFPIDNVPDDDSEWKRFDKKRRILHYLVTAKYTSFRWKNRSLVKNLIIALMKFVLLPFSANRNAKWMDSFARKYSHKKTQRVFESVCGIMQKRPFLRKDFEETIPHAFEQYEFQVMKGYHNYLTCAFGDYMQLPPEKDRHPHHYYIAYWKA